MSESVQWTLIAPVVLLAVLGLVQVGSWLHARNAAASAALAGAETQSWADAAQGSGAAVAERIASQAGLREVVVRVEQSGGLVAVEVTGRADSFFPIGLTRVRSRALQPMERP